MRDWNINVDTCGVMSSVWNIRNTHNVFVAIKGGCAGDEFQCPHFECISNNQVCDGVLHCLGGQDEAECIRFYEDDSSGTLDQDDPVVINSAGNLFAICADQQAENVANFVCRYVKLFASINQWTDQHLCSPISTVYSVMSLVLCDIAIRRCKVTFHL